MILSEITPRWDDKDIEVKKCNEIIGSRASELNFVYLAKHDNLRNGSGRMYSDVKHIKRDSVPVFVANIKNALRKAYDMPTPTYRNNQYRNRNTFSHGGNSRHYDMKKEFEDFKTEIRNILRR